MAANDFVVGLDCGTSYVKATAKTVDGKILGHSRLRSPSEIKSVFEEGDCFFRSHQWWIAFEKVIRNLRDENELQLSRLRGICISGITPTLTVFDAARPEDAFSIPYWYIPSVDIPDRSLGLQSFRFRKDLTRERIRILTTLAASRRMKLPCVTDLVGYLNWYLTGVLTINSIALAELGLSNSGSDLAELQVKGGLTPRCAAPLDNIAVSQNRPLEGVLSPARITVCCGCADTIASIVGGGPQQKSELMIYLGTFGSLLRIDVPVEIVLTEASLHTVPYTWLLSVPRFGSTVEGFTNRWFPRLKREHR
ncbi:MAG TPA: FGGY family carbohydrate kinase, partial [Anaerolineales bacterium]|nr:FGGY family carbohydrate kinase [Anaerolineales bacterium]